MIVDSLKNAELYLSLHPGFKKAFEFLETCSKEFPDAGKYIIDGEGIYASVQEYDTTPEENNFWEAHRKYIDIQFIKSGRELIGYSHTAHVKDFGTYSDEKDCMLATGTSYAMFVDMLPGYFAIFYPDDVHKPKCLAGEKTHVQKIVVKVLLNQ